ncbi:MAG: hypothetical protein [Bacteriophage sp.]|nr:MAG: hypothetical protein [Bacteriophage sp.]
MTIQEFQSRTQVSVDVSEFESITTVYIQSDVDKDTFCKMWCKMNATRVMAAKEQAKKQQTIDKVFSMVMTNPEWTDVEHYNDIAVAVLSSKDKALIESIGISLESEPDNNGFRHFKRFRELRPEINAFLKNA